MRTLKRCHRTKIRLKCFICNTGCTLKYVNVYLSQQILNRHAIIYILCFLKGSFPSKNFYHEKLLTDKSVLVKYCPTDLEPYVLYDLKKSQEIIIGNDGAFFNPVEADFVVELCKRVQKSNQNYSIGVITPYQQQAQHLISRVNPNEMPNVEIGTVDSYQGREKDIIIFSCVRAKSFDKKIGFLVNNQRLNVSLTRAKYGMYIVCHVDSLQTGSDDWKNCIEDAKNRNLIKIVN